MAGPTWLQLLGDAGCPLGGSPAVARGDRFVWAVRWNRKIRGQFLQGSNSEMRMILWN